MKENRVVAIRVGLMTIMSFLFFIGAIIFISKWQLSTKGFTMDIQFSFLNNLSVGAPVRIAGGINIGFVQKIYQENLNTYARIYLKNSLRGKIPKNEKTYFAIFTQGLMGQKYVNLHIGEAKEEDEYYQPGDEVIGIDPPSIDQMLLSFSSWFDGNNGGQIIAQIVHETKLFINILNSIAAENRKDIRLTIVNTRKSVGSLSKELEILVKRLNLLSENLVDISSKNKTDINQTLGNLSLISEDLNLITKRITSGRGSVGKLLADDQLYKDVYATIHNAKEFFDLLKREPWRLVYPR